MALKFTRRALLRIFAGGLFAGLIPAYFRRANEKGENFSFAVLNDTHAISQECERYLEKVAASIEANRPRFCLIAGDLSENGTKAEFEILKAAFQKLSCPLHVTIGNHDYLSGADRSPFEEVFKNSINYLFEEDGWCFMGLDTTNGRSNSGVYLNPATWFWLDGALTQIRKEQPLVVFTHMPLGEKVPSRLRDADQLLERLSNHNVQAIFSGHYHYCRDRFHPHRSRRHYVY